jgi:hypothetical protein
LTVNGSYVCNEAVTFSVPAAFGNNGVGSSSIVLNSGCSWTGSAVTVNVNTFSATNNPVSIYTPLIFACSSSTNVLTFTQATKLSLFGNLFFNTYETINFAGTNFGAITVTSTLNTTATGINPVALVTFTSSSSVEPIISFQGALTQPILLTGPTRLESITLGGQSSVTSQNGGRADFTNALTITSAVTITTPYNFYVTSNNSQFLLTVNPGTPNVFTFSPPPIPSPYGFPLPPSYVFNVGSGSTIKFIANPTYTFYNAIITGSGTVRFSGGNSISVQSTLLVNPGATLWADLVPITAYNLTLAPAQSSTTSPSYLKFSLANNNPTPIKPTYSIYGGGAIIYLSNYIPPQLSGITIVMPSGGASGNVLSPVGGSPGYTYALSRSGFNLQLSVTPNTRPTNAPTQSNGPSPPVNGVPKAQILSFALLFLSTLFYLISL